MNKETYYYNTREGNGDEPDAKLAAAYGILRDLSEDELKSWLEHDDISPSKYEREAADFLSGPIDEKIADVKARAEALALESRICSVKRLREAPCEFSRLKLLNAAKAAALYCVDTELESTEQRTLDLCDWYEEQELTEKLPWASSQVVIMRSPVKDNLGMVRYRALLERRERCHAGGAVCIALAAGEHRDRVRLEHKQWSKIFGTTLPRDVPTYFAPILQ